MSGAATIARVVRGEGLASAMRRAAERIAEALQRPFDGDAAIVNYCATRVAAREGGVAVQLMARLRAERELRAVRLARDFDELRGAKAVHLEGTANAPVAELLALGVPLVVSVHDLTLLEHPLRRQLLAAARAVIFPSRFLRECYGGDGEIVEIVEPVSPARAVPHRGGRGVAFAGSVKRHKGGHLLPDLARLIDRPLHVFGGGDVELLLPLRRLAIVHGYYRAGTLPSLLARHRIGVVVLPSIVPESFSLVLSEAWLAGASVAAFDLGAPAERIREHGGGMLAPLESGAAGLARLVDLPMPPARAIVASPESAARAHVELYRRLGLL